MKDEEFFEYIKHDLKRIESDLIGFLEVYCPMLRSSWNPQNETDFIIGWPVVLFDRNIIQNMIRLPRKRCMFLLVYDG